MYASYTAQTDLVIELNALLFEAGLLLCLCHLLHHTQAVAANFALC